MFFLSKTLLKIFQKFSQVKSSHRKKKFAKNKNFPLIFWIGPRRVEQAQKQFHGTKTRSCGSIWKYVKIEVFWLYYKKSLIFPGVKHYNILFNKNPPPLIFEKMKNFQNGLEWPHFTSRTSGTSHSIGFRSVLNLKTEKKSFRRFQPIESGLVCEQIFFFAIFSIFCPEKSPYSMGWKFRKFFFSIFKLSTE